MSQSSELPDVVSLREQQEALTRHTILSAAREQFAQFGYAATPIRTLARRAGVAPQTIYANFGSKAGVLAGLPDLVDHEAGIADLFAARHETSDPTELLGLLATISRRIRELCGDIVKVLRSGAAVEPDIAATLQEGMRRQRLSVEAVLAQVRDAHALAQHLTLDRATDIATALMSHDVCDQLIDHGHWSYDEYEAWLRDTLTTLLLEQPGEQ